jgi:hypothetical protein
MEPLEVAQHMEEIIRKLAIEGQRGKELVEAKASALVDYKKERAVRALFHKNAGMAVTLIKHQADGDAADMEGYMTLTADEFKIHLVRMDNLKAQLNGYQSIYKHLDTTGK